MTQFPQETNLTKSRGGDSLIFHFQPNALQGNNLIRLTIPSLVDDSIRSFSQIRARLFNLLITASVKETNVSNLSAFSGSKRPPLGALLLFLGFSAVKIWQRILFFNTKLVILLRRTFWTVIQKPSRKISRSRRPMQSCCSPSGAIDRLLQSLIHIHNTQRR